MKRRWCGLVVLLTMMAMVASTAVSQPPPGPGDKKGPPRFELGQIFPPPLVDELKLTPDQQRAMESIKADLKKQLEALLTAEQKRIVSEFRPRFPGEKGKLDGPTIRPKKENPPEPVVTGTTARLTLHGTLKAVSSGKSPFTLTGDVSEGPLGDPRQEYAGSGIRLLTAEDSNRDGLHAGQFSFTVNNLTSKDRWYRVQIRALAQEQMIVKHDELYIDVAFFKDNGKNSLDHVKKSLYGQVERERTALADKGTNKNLGAATWRNYSIDVRTPFPEVDTLQVAIGFGNGVGTGKQSEFWVAEIDVVAIPNPADYAPHEAAVANRKPPVLSSLVKLGGRWYFDPRNGSKEPPKQFDHTNVDRLYYLADQLETPFVGNTSAWLRRGYLDVAGKLVEKDQYVQDAVVISFTDKYLVMKSKNLPNHPTAVFPDRARMIDGNPNYIQEQRDTWYIPLVPTENPKRIAMSMENKKALPMGPIGVAMNGVVFFNPFDHIAEADAVWRLDRCCGHPSPMSQYHYHKYPVCINTPWADDGNAHSPLIGFAFDGYPVYGPYEAKGQLAKDATTNPLNEFNLHTDDARGPHYHVTPGKFPHIIGGYWGEVSPNNRPAKKGSPKK